MKKVISSIVFVFITVSLIASGVAVTWPSAPSAPSAPHANCCLCMCRAKDETLCSRMCIRLQHGKKIVEEPEMIVCAHECERIPVKQVIY
jgi:hypothetical protein